MQGVRTSSEPLTRPRRAAWRATLPVGEAERRHRRRLHAPASAAHRARPPTADHLRGASLAGHAGDGAIGARLAGAIGAAAIKLVALREFAAGLVAGALERIGGGLGQSEVAGGAPRRRAQGEAENITLNRTIFSVMAYAGVGEKGVIDDHVFQDRLCVWRECLQSAICENVTDWEAEKAKVCVEFGWTIDRLRKNPMVLEATLDRVYKKAPIAHLEKLCSAIAKKFGTSVAGAV